MHLIIAQKALIKVREKSFSIHVCPMKSVPPWSIMHGNDKNSGLKHIWMIPNQDRGLSF